nr:reverse transcriptase domain-containing protein [Tanacetum cinerariifolium]
MVLSVFPKGPTISGYIVGMSKQSNAESKIEVIEELGLGAELLDHVFEVPITAVKCIHHGCRLAFSQALKIVLYKVVSQLDSVDAWVTLLLFPRCTLQVCRLKNRQERRSVSLGQGGGDFLEERTTGNTNIRQCLCKVAL